jgi:hypothetical protein
LTWSKRIRQFHRWMAVIFTTVVAAIFITLGLGKEPAYWLYYVPLLPLALLWMSGSYMFVLPYATNRRGAAPAIRQE